MTYSQDPVVIVGYARTPIGKFRGCLSSLSAPELGAISIRSALSRSGLRFEEVDKVLMGCVLSAGLGQAPARQAALKAGLPERVGCVTVNKMCGSGMEAIMLGHDTIKAGSASVVVAGGMESMTNAPYLLPKGRTGLNLGHGDILDHMLRDGLEDPEEKRLMGWYAEDCAAKYGFSREEQDDYAKESLLRAQKAIEEGHFRREIEPVRLALDGQDSTSFDDEQPAFADPAKIPRLKPVFRQDGTVTAANSSSISDGAAAVVLMPRSRAEEMRITPLVEVAGHAIHAQKPSEFTTAPIGAISGLLEKIQMGAADIDLFEINEAFAVVTMVAMRDLDLSHAKTNIHGGACALGHPIGASGARILVTLISALEQYGLQRGIASLCIGGGEATAVALQR